MQFSLAYIKSEQQFALRTFNSPVAEAAKGKIMELEELETQNIQGIFLPADLLKEDSVALRFSEELMNTPIKSAEENDLSIEAFETLETIEATRLALKMNQQWVLQNNLKTLEVLIPTLNHLKALWPNDRTAFFEELWHLLRKNLGPTSLKLVFNDMEMVGERKKLVQVKIEGNKTPNPVPGTEFESNLMKHYDKEFGAVLNIAEFNQEKGQLVFTATINKSPVIVMAEVLKMSSLQKALLKALFEGLQSA
ncbi:MAG: hypothetical protein HN509_18565 [Halobacteriovoraceae bacterium]|jgi:hypothetical protein|nr:hypothetical protein [Halobacteriovoraceae bacterium]